MNVEVFDRVAVVAGDGSSRRRVLGGVAAAFGALVLGDVAFAAKGDKNKNKNKGKGKGKDAPKERNFRANAEGEVTEPAVQNCQMTGDRVCTTEFGGAGTANRLGEVTFASTLTSDWSGLKQLPDGGFCATLLDGSEGTIVSKSRKKGSRGAVSIRIEGEVCQVGGPASTSLELVDATYTVVGGTGVYKDATGQGSVDGQVTDIDGADFALKGKITY